MNLMVVGYQITNFSQGNISYEVAINRLCRLYPHKYLTTPYLDNKNRYRITFRSNRINRWDYRSRVYYSVFHDLSITLGCEVHHDDLNIQNDVYDNLILMEKVKHCKLHNSERANNVTLICDYCNKLFELQEGEIKTRQKLGNTSCYCSHSCRNKARVK